MVQEESVVVAVGARRGVGGSEVVVVATLGLPWTSQPPEPPVGAKYVSPGLVVGLETLDHPGTLFPDSTDTE